MQNKVTDIIQKIYPLSKQAADFLLSIAEIQELKKEDVFVHVNYPDHKEYIVIAGVCRSFVSDADANEATLSFFTNGHVLPPNLSRTTADKSIFNIQAVTDSKLLSFSQKEFAELMSKNIEISRWGNTVLSDELFNKVNKELNLITMSAKDHLIEFRKKYPLLENLIPHPYIASYLGISPVSLSRLRKQIK